MALGAAILMNSTERQSLAAILVILLIGGGIAWAGSQGSHQVGGIPLFAWCALLTFVINWLAFVPAYLFQTERYFDLTGSITYLSLVLVALVLRGEADSRALLLGGLVAIWALRLGIFLFTRILREGSDRRFDALKPSLVRFLMTWTLQGLWVLLTLSCALAAMTAMHPRPLGLFAVLGTVVWAGGFAIEAVADRQKRCFRSDSANRDLFIQSGLWAWSRHPNYFGEIILWIGVAIIALPVLAGWQHVTLISPVFVYVLLTRVSGIPLLETRATEKWGDEPEYRVYRERTPILFPRPPRKASLMKDPAIRAQDRKGVDTSSSTREPPT
jgi:steroid 5-alpha reductase family enzyme